MIGGPLDLIDQISLIEIIGRREMQQVLLKFALCGLVCIALFVYGIILKYYFKRLGKFLMRMGWLSAIVSVILLTPMVVKAYQHGSTKEEKPKHLWEFEYVNGVYDRGSYCTNDEIHAWWRYDPAARDFTIMASYQDLTITNEHGVCIDDLHPLEEVPVVDEYHVWDVANATNMRVVVFASYVAPPAVHTNGVYHLDGVMPAISNATKYVTPGISISVNLETGETEILTPTNKPPVASINETIEEKNK